MRFVMLPDSLSGKISKRATAFHELCNEARRQPRHALSVFQLTRSTLQVCPHFLKFCHSRCHAFSTHTQTTQQRSC